MAAGGVRSAGARRGTPRRETSRADWRRILELAGRCAVEVQAVDAEDHDFDVRRMTLCRDSGRVTVGAFHAAGAATEDLARAFVRTAQAFARPETPMSVRREAAPVLAAAAAFLDAALTRMAEREFQQAHRGRPEVWG